MSSPNPVLSNETKVWCNICGGLSFGTGPFGRLSSNGKMPCCKECGSLERHRSLRAIFHNMPLGLFHGARVMQFSHDPALDPRWCGSYERSIYGVENTLDLQDIDRPNESYDFISMNHVLEFVVDAKAAFRELTRICAPRGLIQVAFSRADSRPKTLDYAEPQDLNGFYHLFGRDMAEYFRLSELGMQVHAQPGQDPVTGVVELFHFFCRDQNLLDILNTWPANFEWSKPKNISSL